MSTTIAGYVRTNLSKLQSRNSDLPSNLREVTKEGPLNCQKLEQIAQKSRNIQDRNLSDLVWCTAAARYIEATLKAEILDLDQAQKSLEFLGKLRPSLDSASVASALGSDLCDLAPGLATLDQSTRLWELLQKAQVLGYNDSIETEFTKKCIAQAVRMKLTEAFENKALMKELTQNILTLESKGITIPDLKDQVADIACDFIQDKSITSEEEIKFILGKLKNFKGLDQNFERRLQSLISEHGNFEFIEESKSSLLPNQVTSAAEITLEEDIIPPAFSDSGVWIYIKGATIKRTGTKVAVKINKAKEEKKLVNIRNEIETSQKIGSNPYFLDYYGSYLEEEMHYEEKWYVCGLVMERCKTTLERDLKEKIEANQRYEDDAIKYVFSQLIEGYLILHKKKIYHLDIKPHNIFLKENLELKIADFDVSLVGGQSTRTVNHGGVGTEGYMAPEIQEAYDNNRSQDLKSLKVKFRPDKADTYSLGMTLLQLCTMSRSVNTLNSKEKWSAVQSNINNAQPEWTRPILLQMLNPDYKQRPKLTEIKGQLSEPSTRKLTSKPT